MKKVTLTKRNLFLTALVASMVAVLILSIVLPLTLIDISAADTAFTPIAPETESIPSISEQDTVTSTPKYSAGITQFSDRVVKAGSVPSDYVHGLSDVQQIATAADFSAYIAASTADGAKYKDYIQDGSYRTNFVLTNDIEITSGNLLTNANFGYSGGSYVFDGQGHTITIKGTFNQTMSGTIDSYGSDFGAAGIFARANWGVIKNVNLVFEKSTINFTSAGIGAAIGLLVGWNNGTIKNVSVTVKSDATITMLAADAYDTVLGGIIGIGASRSSQTVVVDNVRTTLDGTLKIDINGQTEHIAVGGIIGRLDSGTYTNLHIDGANTGRLRAENSSGGWRFIGGIAGLDRTSGASGNNIPAASGTLSINTTIIDTFKGKVVMSSTSGENYAGRLFGFSTDRTYNIDLYTLSSTIAETTGNQTGGIEEGSNLALGLRGADGTVNCTQHQMTLVDAGLGFCYTFPAEAVDTGDGWDGVVAYYIGTPTEGYAVSSTEISGESNAEIDQTYGYVRIKDGGNNTFSWVEEEIVIPVTPEEIKEFLASTTELTTTITLAEDITLIGTESDKIYINSHDIAYGAMFDGGGYTLTISGVVEVADDVMGIIASTNNGIIRNLNLVLTSDIQVSSDKFGIVAGVNDGSVIYGSTMPGAVQNVTVSGNGTVTLESTAEEVVLGGVVAESIGYYSYITSVTSNITIPNRLMATTTHATGTAIVGGIVGINDGGGLSSCSVSLTTEGSIKAYSSTNAIVGGAAGASSSAITEVVVNNNANAGGGILATNIGSQTAASTIKVGGVVGYISNGVINFSKIAGGGDIGITTSPNSWNTIIGGFVADFATPNSSTTSNITEFTGTFIAEVTSQKPVIQGKIFGTATASSIVNIFYRGDENLTGLLGATSTITLRHQRVQVEGDLIIKGEITSGQQGRVIVNSVNPTMGIENESTGVGYDSITNSVLLQPQATDAVFTWDWIDSYGGIENYGETIVYGEDYLSIDVPAYTDGWATDYGRVIAGYGIPLYATRIETSAQLLEWLSIERVPQDDGSVKYLSGSVEYDKNAYDYAYLYNDIRINNAVFFNAQGILAAGRTLDGCGYTIISEKSSNWYSLSHLDIPAEIYNPAVAADADIIAKAGLTGLGNGNKITVTSGLVAINHGTIKNVTYQVAVQQKISDRAIYKGTPTAAEVGNNWVHGYISGINTGIIENVNVRISNSAQFHHDDVRTGFVYIIGGVTGYNYNGRVSYASTTIDSGALFNSSSRDGGLIFGGVVGLSNGGVLDHLKVTGSGTMSITDLRKPGGSTTDNTQSPYMFGGIVGAMENSYNNTTEPDGTVVDQGYYLAIPTLTIKRTELKYVYNGFLGTYGTENTTANSQEELDDMSQYILQGIIAGRISSSATLSSTNPRILGVMFLTKYNYFWAQPYTPAGNYTYTNNLNQSGDNKLSVFGGLATNTTAMFSGGGIHVSGLEGAVNGYFDYWTRLDTNNNGFAIEFEKVASISNLTAQLRFLNGGSNSEFPSGTLSTTLSSHINWNRDISGDNVGDEYRVYLSLGYLDGAYSSGYAFPGLCISVTMQQSLSSSLKFGSMEKSSVGYHNSGTRITNSTRFPLYGNDTYYLTENVTISSDIDQTRDAFNGTIYGNGYTITFTGSEEYQYADYSNGVLTSNMGGSSTGKIYDLNIVYAKTLYFGKPNNSDSDYLKSVGIITGCIDSSNVVIDNVSITTNSGSTFRGDQTVNWNSNKGSWFQGVGVSAGLIAGHITAGTISNIYINHNGALECLGTVDATSWSGELYVAELSAGIVAGLTNNSPTIKNIILSGSGSIQSSGANSNPGYSNMLIGRNFSSNVSVSNIAVWGASYTLTGSSGKVNYFIGGNSANCSKIYTVNGQSEAKMIGVTATAIRFMNSSSANISYSTLLGGYTHEVKSVNISIGRGTSNSASPSVYMDAAVYSSSANDFQSVVEKYIVRNAHRGNVIWSSGDGTADYYAQNKTPNECHWTKSGTRGYYNTFTIGVKAKIVLVDGLGNIVSEDEIVNTRNYDGTKNVTAVYESILEVVEAGLLSQEEASNMLSGEVLNFLKNKYQYSYQIFDITGTTPLLYNEWQGGSEFDRALTVSSELVGTHSVSKPQTKEFNSVSYDYFNADRYIYAPANSSGISGFSYTINEAVLIASPATATNWSEKSSINFYIPRGQDGAITRLEFYDDPQGTTSTLSPQNYDQYAYSQATMTTSGGVSYTLLKEKDRDGTTYYVGAYKLNETTNRYVRVASNTTVFTMIDEFAPVIGVMRGSDLDENVTSQDVQYTVGANGESEYGEIKLYIKDVSLQSANIELVSTPLSVRESAKTQISVAEYADGIIYTVRCYDSATFTLSATDQLERTSTKDFTIDIVRPQLLINDQLATYNNSDSQYNGAKFINDKNHKVYISALSDNLTYTQDLRQNLSWEIVDNDTNTVLFSSADGQQYDIVGGYITLPLGGTNNQGVFCENAIFRIWVEDNVGNRTTVTSNNGNPIIIDTRDYTVRYGESLINKEGPISVRPTLLVTEGATGTTRFVAYDSSQSTKLKRFDHVIVSSVDNTSNTGYTYIGYGVDVNYVYDPNRELEYSQEQLEIGVNMSHTLRLDGGNYGASNNVAMTTDVKIVLFYTVALDIQLNEVFGNDYIVDVNQNDTTGIALSNIVSRITLSSTGAQSLIVNNSNFAAYINMVIYNENNEVVSGNIPFNKEGIYSITFTVKADANYDKYYSITNSLFSVSVVNPSNTNVSFSMSNNNAISLEYNKTSAIYGGNWSQGTLDTEYGWKINQLLQSAFDNDVLTITTDKAGVDGETFVSQYFAVENKNVFEDMRYTIIYKGSVYQKDYIYDAGIYNITAQVKPNKGYTASFSFVVDIAKTQVVFRPYEQQTVYGYTIDANAYYVKWSAVSIKDKQQIEWTGLRYEITDADANLANIYYYKTDDYGNDITSVKIIIGTLNLNTNQVDIFGDTYTWQTVSGDIGKIIDFYQFKSDALSEYPRAITSRRDVNTYTGYNGITMDRGSSSNYNINYSGQYAPRLTITKRYIEVKILDDIKYYNGDDPASYRWELCAGSEFAYEDGEVNFVTNIKRTYPASGVDNVNTDYNLYGTVSNPNYDVYVYGGKLYIEALKLSYYVTGTENLTYSPDVDHFGTLEVIVTNAKKGDNVTAKIYYQIGYSISGSEDPIFVDENLVPLYDKHVSYINTSNRTFRGRLTTEETEPIQWNAIQWIKSDTYYYRIKASSSAENFESNYTNIITSSTSVNVSGYILNVVALDQIITFGSLFNGNNIVGTTYKLEGVVAGDTVTLSYLTIGGKSVDTNYSVGKYVGEITINDAVYHSTMGLKYDVRYVYGNLIVEPAVIKIDWSTVQNSQVYTGNNLAATFTSGVTANLAAIRDRLTFTYINSANVEVASIIDAGGYLIKANLPDAYQGNYYIDANTEYYAVNIDKASITMKAFGNSYWNATDDAKGVEKEYKKFTTETLSTILSSSNITLHNINGGSINTTSRPAEYSTWTFVVSNISAGNVTHTSYGGNNTNQWPTTVVAGTYEVIVIVPESKNYYGITQRVMFVRNPDTGNGGSNTNYARAASGHYTINSEYTSLSGLGGNVGYLANKGNKGSPSGLNLGSTSVGATKVRQEIAWMYYYFNIELSDEYYMLAQQGLLNLTISGTAYSSRWKGTVFDWNEADSTAIVVRGISSADDYYYGTSSLGENTIDGSWHPNYVYSNINGFSDKYVGLNSFRSSVYNEYTANFNASFTGNHAAYRVYLIAWISDSEINSLYDSGLHGYLSFSFSNLAVSVSVKGSSSSYSMETVDKSTAPESTEQIYIPTSSSGTLYNLSANPAWVKVGNQTYYFTKQGQGVSAGLYTNTQLTIPAYGSSVQEYSNYLMVSLRTNYNTNARVWRFTVGNTSTGYSGIDPYTFQIKIKPKTGATETWSVANGKIQIKSITNLYNQIVFETVLLNDEEASLEELSVKDYAGIEKDLIKKGYLDNTPLTIQGIKVSSSGQDDTFTAFSSNSWYKEGQYIEFTIKEVEESGYTGVNMDQVSVYYLDSNNQKVFVDSMNIDSKAPTAGGNQIIEAVFRTTDMLATSNIYYISAKDKQGNETIYTLNFHFDDTSDQDEIYVTTANDVLLDTWYDGDVTIRTEVNIDLTEDLAVSLGKLQYLATDNDMSSGDYQNHTGWLSMTLQYDEETGKYFSELTLDRSQVKYYMFRFETGAGNYIYNNLGLIKIDKTEPKVDVTVFNTLTDNLVLSGRWEKGSVTFSITGTIGISGGSIEYTSGGTGSATWYKQGDANQPAIFTVTKLSDKLYTATIVVTTDEYIQSNYAIRYKAGNGKTVTVIFGNGTNEFDLKIDNDEPIITTDVIAWQAQAQDAMIDVTDKNQSGIGEIIIEEKAKGSNEVIAFFTLDGAYVGAYNGSVEGATKYIDVIYDIVRINNIEDFAYLNNDRYVGKMFRYTGETSGTYVKNSFYKVNADYGLTRIDTLQSADTSEGMIAFLTAANLGNYYTYTGTTSSEFGNGSIYKVVEDGSSYRFKLATEGATRKITSQSGVYYFKFDDKDYTIHVYDAVGNESKANYTPQVDSYEPTLSVVAIQYENLSDVNFTYHVINDETVTFDSRIDDMIKVYMFGDENASYHILFTLEGDNYFAYIFGVDSSSPMVKAMLSSTNVAYKQSFNLSSATVSGLASLRIEEIVFYPDEARLQVRTMDDEYGDGVAPEHIYQYTSSDNWTTNTVKFIVTRWTAGPSGGALYYSNGVVSAISQWKVLKTAPVFSATEGYRDYSNQNIQLIADVEGANNYTFFYRSTSNIMVYYNYQSHKSETKNSLAEAAGKYNFNVQIDTLSPVISELAYLTQDGNYDQTIGNKQDWWTTGAMQFRFIVEDGGEQKLAKSGLDINSIKVVDEDGIEIVPTFDGVYYNFSITKTSTYTVMVSDMVGNYTERIITQYGSSPILIDTTSPTIDVQETYVQGEGNWSKSQVVFDISATYGDSGAIVEVEYYVDGVWSTHAIIEEIDGTYVYILDEELNEAITLRFKITNGAGKSQYSSQYTFRVDTIAPEVTYVAYLAGTKQVVDISGSNWKQDAVDIEFFVSDSGSGIKSGSIKYRKGTTGGFTSLSPVGGRYYIYNVEDTSVYQFVVSDNAGNENQNQDFSWNIDAVVPTIDSFTVKLKDGSDYISGQWASQPVIVSFRVGFAVSDEERAGEIQVSTNGGEFEILNCTKTYEEEVNGVFYFTFTHEYSNIDSTYVYNAISKAGKVSSNTTEVAIKVDAGEPSITAQYTIDNIAWDFATKPWATRDIVVKLSATVGISGGYIEVYKNDAKIATLEHSAEEYQIPLTNEIASYYFKVVKSGTLVAKSTEVQLVQFDNVEPDIDINTFKADTVGSNGTLEKYEKGIWTKDDVILDITLKVGASYKQTSFYMTIGLEEKLIWSTLDGLETILDSNVSDWNITAISESVFEITFKYIITADVAINPVVETNVMTKAVTGSGAVATDNSYGGQNSIRIDKFTPSVTVNSITKVDSNASYTYVGNAWAWTDNKDWSSKQVRMSFTLTYYESGASLKYREGEGNSYVNTSIIYGRVERASITVNGMPYNVYIVDCTLTIGSDKNASYEFIAESGAGKSSVGHKYYNDNVLTDDANNFSITLKIDMTNPTINNFKYYRDTDNDGIYETPYNPERVKYVTDAAVKVTFDANDILSHGVASRVDTVEVNGIAAYYDSDAENYWFFITDCNEYEVVVADHAGRTSSTTIQIGVDSYQPTIGVAVVGGTDGIGYSFDLDSNYDDISWSTSSIEFSFATGTTFGSSGGVILYSFDKVNWTTNGSKDKMFTLTNKITYGNRIYFKAKTTAGKETLEEDIVEVVLKVDLKEYTLNWTQNVGSYKGTYADVSSSTTGTFLRGDIIEISVTPFAKYTYNYRIVNDDTITTPLADGKFAVEVVDKDLNVNIYFKESVTATYSNLTQYLKYLKEDEKLIVPVSVKDSRGNTLTADITYTINGNESTTIENLGNSDVYPIGDYTISVDLHDDDNYILEEDNTQIFKVRYFRQAGTVDDPYLIDKAEDFKYLNTTIYDTVDAHFAMTTSIVFTEGLSIGDFKGNLDGRNYKIALSQQLLKIGLETQPMFAEIKGTVENVGIEIGATEVAVSGNYTTNPLYYGFVAQKLSGTIRNSYIVSTIDFVEKSTLSGSLFIGGLVGQVMATGTVSNVYVDAMLDIRGLADATSIGIGGMAGQVLEGGLIKDSFSTSSIYTENMNSILTGMIAPTGVSLDTNKVVDDNIYIGGRWTAVRGNTTYYQLITDPTLANTQITRSNITGRGEPTFVHHLASARYKDAFTEEPTFENGNLCFEISTSEEFAKINDFLWADYKQVADIEVTDIVIANGSVYRGTYDGGGHTLTVNATTTTGYGLFDKVSGTIKNLNITTGDEGFKANITDGSDPIVALLVKELDGGTVDQIVIGGDFSFESSLASNFIVGALVGVATNATITDIVSTIYLSADAKVIDIGALVGKATDSYIDNAYVVSTVNVSYSQSASIGSIAGIVEGATTAQYYYDDKNLYSNISTGTANIENGTITSLTISGNTIDKTKFFITIDGLVSYNNNYYTVKDGELYLAVGTVEIIGADVNSITIDGKKYTGDRFTFDKTQQIVEVDGVAYAFRSNTYANSTSRESLVGYLDANTRFEYTDLDTLMDINSSAVIAEGNYVRDNLYAMYRKEFSAGTGTAADPFILAEKSDFKKVSRYMYAHYKIKLSGGVSSLTFEDGEWETIGVGMNFTGSITADSYVDNLGYPKTIALYGITDTFIDRNYGTISDFIINVDINKEIKGNTTFGIVSNYNYGTIANMDVSGNVVLFVRGAYELVAGGITGEYAAKDNTSKITSCALNITAILRAQTVTAGLVAGRAINGAIDSIGLDSSISVYSSSGKGVVGAYLGEKLGSVTITRKSGNVDTANTILSLNGTKIVDVEANLIGITI